MQLLNEPLSGLIRSEPLLLLQFGDESCGPCHAIGSRLDRWLEDHNGVTARYIPIREHLEACSQMGIFTVPTIAVYMDGRLLARESGYFSLDQLLERADRYIALRSEAALDIEPDDIELSDTVAVIREIE